jgi:transposase
LTRQTRPLYLLNVPSLTAKVVHGRRYWQIITSQRIHGKPRQIVLAHLGTADTLLARLQQKPGEPIQARIQQFGLLAAAWSLAQRLQLVSLIDRHVPKRRQGASVGQYLVLAALNRLTSPRSKAQMAHWYQQTTLRRWLPLSRKQLRSQRFWDAMEAVDERAIGQIEADLSRRLVEGFGIDVRCLCCDCTNFDTFLDSRTRSELAQRGHAKSKRADLRVVGLALLVSTDFNIPLFSRVYPGNQPDSITFGSVTEELIKRYRVLAKNLEPVTLVFDKGNHSEENLEGLVPSPFHVVGSLVPTQHRDLLEVALDRFQSLEDSRLEGVTAFRTSKKVFGRDGTILVTHSQELLDGQLRGIAQVLRKRRRALAELQWKLKRSQEPGAKGKGYTLKSLQAHAQNLSAGQYLQKILRVEIRRQGGKLQLNYHTDGHALEKLTATSLGRRILFTDNHEWTTEEIILAYRSQHHVEAAFRTMKNPYFVGWEPMYHWTDQKIRVHALYCVIALTLAGLLHREARRAGLDLSLEAVCQELSSICEVINLYASIPGKAGRLRAATTYTEPTPTSSRLTEIFRLNVLKAR